MKRAKSHILMLVLILALLLPYIAHADTLPALGPVIFSQPITIIPGVGYGGADVSSIPDTGYGYLGYTATKFPNGLHYSVADDFTLVETTNITGAAFYINQFSPDGNRPALPTEAFAAIYDNSPALGGHIIWGDLTTNVFYEAKPLNLYRVFDNDLLSRTFPMSILTLCIDVTLLPGTYWIEFFTFPSINYLGPYVPLTYASQTPAILNFNALQNRIDFVGKWVTISSADDGSDHFEPSALIFDLYGFVIPVTGDSISAHLYIPILLLVLSAGFLTLLIIKRIRLSRNNAGSR